MPVCHACPSLKSFVFVVYLPVLSVKVLTSIVFLLIGIVFRGPVAVLLNILPYALAFVIWSIQVLPNTGRGYVVWQFQGILFQTMSITSHHILSSVCSVRMMPYSTYLVPLWYSYIIFCRSFCVFNRVSSLLVLILWSHGMCRFAWIVCHLFKCG